MALAVEKRKLLCASSFGKKIGGAQICPPIQCSGRIKGVSAPDLPGQRTFLLKGSKCVAGAGRGEGGGQLRVHSVSPE